jgi:hypothetical protein
VILGLKEKNASSKISHPHSFFIPPFSFYFFDFHFPLFFGFNFSEQRLDHFSALDECGFLLFLTA